MYHRGMYRSVLISVTCGFRTFGDRSSSFTYMILSRTSSQIPCYLACFRFCFRLIPYTAPRYHPTHPIVTSISNISTCPMILSVIPGGSRSLADEPMNRLRPKFSCVTISPHSRIISLTILKSSSDFILRRQTSEKKRRCLNVLENTRTW